MKIRVATVQELVKICVFYKQVCLDQKSDEYSPDWHWGIYPSEIDLKQKLENATVIIAIDNDKVISAGVLTKGEDPNYLHVNWDHDNAIVLHLFAVAKTSRGQGLAQKMLSAFDDYAKEHDYRAIHLDVMKGNVPAEKLYQKHGYQFVEEATIHYEDDGDTQAMMYQKDLK